MKIDFTGITSDSFEPIPSSWYKAMVMNYKESKAGEQSKNPDAPIINWEFCVQGGNYDQRRVFDNMVIVHNTLWKLKGFLQAVGEEVDDVSDYDFESDDFVGRELDIKVSVQPARKNQSTGEVYEARNVVKAYRPHNDTEDDILP